MTISLDFAWPASPPTLVEDFFVGAWHPEHRLEVAFGQPPDTVRPCLALGRNWCAVSNTSALLPDGRGLVHRAPASLADEPAKAKAVVFRGYLLEPPIQSWSDSALVYGYWAAEASRLHNGVFAAVRIEDSRLELVNDAFGIAPLYYRQLANGVVLFASSPRYLRCPGDALDPLAARMLMHRGSLCGDVSLAPGVLRVPAGSRILFSSRGPSLDRWFPFASLPAGERPIDAQAVERVEQALHVAVARSLQLMPGACHHLPLSSGHDSRRLLALLQRERASFQAVTLRRIHRGLWELDGRYAAQMARDFGFAHEVLPCASPPEYAQDDRCCRLLWSSELSEHSWMLPLVRRLRPHPSLVFDGLGGDIFNNTGFGIAELHTIPEQDKLAAIAEHSLPAAADAVLKPDAWVSLQQARCHLIETLEFLPPGKNRSDYAFVLTRSRRSVGAWSQNLLPPGHLAVYPYLDLEYIQASMEYDPLDKLKATLQARCLERYWPQYFAYPGTRRVPADLAPEDGSLLARWSRAKLDQLRSECRSPVTLAEARACLRPSRYCLALLSATSGAVKTRCAWWLEPLLTLLSWENQAVSCWKDQPATHDAAAGFSSTESLYGRHDE
jgi:asparagine synthetase B (glutamine-hydrolysing)